MQFNLKFMREFFKFFRTTEGDARVDDSLNMSTREVGEINVITPTDKYTFVLAITNDGHTNNTAYMVKTVDGNFIVVLHIDYFIKQVYSDNMNGLYAVVAHEIGHYLAGHFEQEADAFVDVKREVQQFFFNRYKEDTTLANEISYMRSVFFSLLKGGVVVRELEADLTALRFVPVADLVHVHSQDFNNPKNVFTVVEKVNRIKRLNQYVEDHDIEREGYHLFIQLYDINKKEEA